MSDRRMSAIRAVEHAQIVWDELPPDVRAVTDWADYITDAALAVIDAEPTEAEVEAAAQAYSNAKRAMHDTGLDAWTDGNHAMRAALIAARKARQ